MPDKPCSRCSTCDKNWPHSGDFKTCPTCGLITAVVHRPAKEILTVEQARAILMVEEAPEDPPLQGSIHPNSVYSHRFAVFMKIGFGPAESSALANTREDTHRVKKMVQEQGCDIDTAVAILL